VRRVQFNAVTKNLLICYDPHVAANRVAGALAAPDVGRAAAPPPRLTLFVPAGEPDRPAGGDLRAGLPRAIQSARRVVDAAELLLGGKSALMAGGLTGLGLAALRLALEALLHRDTAEVVGLVAECLTAAVTGSALALALTAAEAVVRLACRASLPADPRPDLPADPPPLAAAA
jgi:hypothetical protein